MDITARYAAKRTERIKRACNAFIHKLGKDAEYDEVFGILAEVAPNHGLLLMAEQRGIGGTYVHFVKASI